MRYAGLILTAFAPAILPSACEGNRMALTPRRERTIKGVTS